MKQRTLFLVCFLLLVTVACSDSGNVRVTEEPEIENETQEVNITPTVAPAIERTIETPTPSVSPTDESLEDSLALSTATANSTPSPGVRVINSSVNIRSGPGTELEPVAFLLLDDVVPVIESSSDGSWHKVRLEDGTEGWVGSTLVELIQLTEGCA